MRTPLARRIPGNELLNWMYCLLPRFDRKTATEVAQLLMPGATNKDGGYGDEPDDARLQKIGFPYGIRFYPC